MKTDDEIGAARDDASGEDVAHRRFLWLIGALIVGALWLRPIASSLWFDEFGTWWTIEGGFHQAIDRAWTYQGQSPLYYLVAWLTRHLIGHAEWALRAPSFVFAAASVYLVHRLVRRLADAEAARIAVLVFIAWPIVAFSAIDARPYALATLLMIAAVLAFIRWLDRGAGWLGVATVVLLAATIWAHYLFALVLIPLGAHAVVRLRDRSTDVGIDGLAAAAAGVALLLAPMFLGLADLWERRGSVALPDGLSVDWVVTLMLPAAVVAGLVVGGALAAANGGRVTTRLRISKADLTLLATWAVAPAAALIVASLASPLGLQGRYSLVWAPAAAILAGLAIRAFEPAMARRIVVMVLALLSVIALGAGNHLGDWRGAMAAISERATDRSVVLVQSGYVESLQLDWYGNAERVAYLGAPASYYSVPGEVVVLPVDVAPAPDFARDRIEAAVADADRVFLVTSTTWMATWVGEVLRGDGFRQEQLFPGTPFAYGYARVAA